MEYWKAFTVIKWFIYQTLIIKFSSTKNKVNSLILDYKIVLGLRISEELHKTCPVKIASSSYM